MPEENHNQDEQPGFWERGAEKVGEAFGRGIVKVIAGALASVVAIGGASLFTHKSAVSEADSHQQWIATNLWQKTQREDTLESNQNRLQTEVDEIYEREFGKQFDTNSPQNHGAH